MWDKVDKFGTDSMMCRSILSWLLGLSLHYLEMTIIRFRSDHRCTPRTDNMTAIGIIHSLIAIAANLMLVVKIDGHAYLGVMPGIKTVWVPVKRCVNGVMESQNEA